MFVSRRQVRFGTHRFPVNACCSGRPKSLQPSSVRVRTNGNRFRFLPAGIPLQGVENESFPSGSPQEIDVCFPPLNTLQDALVSSERTLQCPP